MTSNTRVIDSGVSPGQLTGYEPFHCNNNKFNCPTPYVSKKHKSHIKMLNCLVGGLSNRDAAISGNRTIDAQHRLVAFISDNVRYTVVCVRDVAFG